MTSKSKILKTYFVTEFMTAWTEYEVQATSKAEAIRKIRTGKLTPEEKESSWSNSSGPSGKYIVDLADDQVINKPQSPPEFSSPSPKQG